MISLGPTIFPHQCYLAHLEQVQSVRFSPNASDVLTSVSSDRLCRLWNLANVDVPINEMRRGLMTDAQWLFYWNGILVAQVSERSFSFCFVVILDAAKRIY